MKENCESSFTDLSIICVLYHSKNLILPLLENIRNQVECSYEVVFVDNSGEILESEQIGYENSRFVFPSQNEGYGAGVNFGRMHAKSDVLLIINPDIRILDKITKAQISIVRGSKHSFGFRKVDGKYVYFPSVVEEALLVLANCTFGLPFSRREICSKRLHEGEVDWLIGDFILIASSVFDDLNGFDTSFFLYYEEIDFFRSLKLEGGKCLLFNGRYIDLPVRSSGVDVSQVKTVNNMKSLIVYFRKVRPNLSKLLKWFLIGTLSLTYYSGIFRVLQRSDKIDELKFRIQGLKES